MRALSDAEVLQLWDQGRTRHPIDRALLLLAVAEPAIALDALADVPIGRRDAAILALRNASFGAPIEAYGHCPSCAGRFECVIDGQRLHAAASSPAQPALDDGQGGRLRLPTTRDLLAALASDDPPAALARACCLDGQVMAATEIAQRIAEHDPAVDLELALSCESCGHCWCAAFDPGSYCWEEIAHRAARLFDAVHVLAQSYGWSEDEVLRLGPARRAAYLERCSA